MLVLVDKWGQRNLLTAELKAAANDLRAMVANAKLGTEQRIDAAKRLLSLEDNAPSVEEIVKQITPQATPELQVGLVMALSNSKDESGGKSLVSRWTTLSPSAHRAAIALLLRKSVWTGALLDGIEAGKINPKDLLAEHWQTLTTSSDSALAERAKKLQASAGRAPTADKAKILASLAPILSRTGDVAKGKEVYAKNCQVCHTIEGQGGVVGPDLTGVGARPKGEILSEIVDPNRSVEGTYRSWTLDTEDDTLTGRLVAESQTSVELLDATGAKHAVERKDIKSLSASERSVMPEGFEQTVTQEDLVNLLEYMASSKVKH
jgi:putative heme-binding domain-containing protein